MKAIPAIAAALCFAGPASGSPDAPARLTLREARAMPVAALAARVLGMTGERMAETRVTASKAPFGSPERLGRIDFAMAPSWTGEPHLCSARVVTVEFAPIGRDPRDPGDLPSSAGVVEAHTYWAVLPDGARASGGSAPSARDSDAAAACTRGGPVLPADGTGPGRFFPAGGDDDAELPRSRARLLAELLRALDEPATLAPERIACRSAKRLAGCDDPKALLARIDMLRPVGVDMTACEGLADHLCVEGRFDPVRTGPTQGSFTRVRVVAKRIDTPVQDGLVSWTDSKVAIVSVVLDRVNWIA